MFNYKKIKKELDSSFDIILRENYLFRVFLYEVFVYGSAYLVGGFIRDLIENKKSRDLDIIIDLENDHLLKILENSKISYRINRHNGIKLLLENLEVDIWSIENNWAFKNNLVKLNEEDKIKSIAKGCFYNYDSLVYNLQKKGISLKNYEKFIKNKELDILQKSPSYKLLNPTVEANILRAFYLRKLKNIKYSPNTKNYILTKIGELFDQEKNPIDQLILTKKKYPKYELVLTDKEVKYYLIELINAKEKGDQLHLKL